VIKYPIKLIAYGILAFIGGSIAIPMATTLPPGPLTFLGFMLGSSLVFPLLIELLADVENS
jgi:hypothetical protein